MASESMDKIIGSPWKLINVADFLVIGLMSLLFMLMLQILGMGWHRMQLLRVTGSARSVTAPVVFGAGPSSTIDPNSNVGNET